jgi:uncharacterized protein (DUF302 family)
MNEQHFPAPPQIEGIITKPSSFSAERLVERLQEAMRSRGLTIFAHINHTEEARRVGLEMQEAHVLIFGNPKAGTPLMIASPACGARTTAQGPDLARKRRPRVGKLYQ